MKDVVVRISERGVALVDIDDALDLVLEEAYDHKSLTQNCDINVGIQKLSPIFNVRVVKKYIKFEAGRIDDTSVTEHDTIYRIKTP
ncbi:hypothetical protein KI387_008893, partial [Taxus chinensis]